VHIKIRYLGKERLTTQLFVPGSAYLDSDYVEGAVSPDLIMDMRPKAVAVGEPPTFAARFDFSISAIPRLEADSSR
jgi:catechol 1,2-dioxygenase